MSTSIRQLRIGGLWALLALAVTLGPRLAAQADPAPSPLRCAVDASLPKVSPKALCDQLANALGRTAVVVSDARKEAKGESVQIMRDDVQWTLVLLRRGVVRSWTRVSVADARGREAAFFARALRSLLQAVPKGAEACVRLDPNKDRSKRAPDLVYPWVELKPCVRQVVDVVDPWWSTEEAK